MYVLLLLIFFLKTKGLHIESLKNTSKKNTRNKQKKETTKIKHHK